MEVGLFNFNSCLPHAPYHKEPHPNLREKTASEQGSGVCAYAGARRHFPLRVAGGCVLWCRKEAANEHLVPRGAGGKDQ